MKGKEKKIKLTISDPICEMMLENYDSDYLKEKPWMGKLKMIKFERN